MKKAVAIALMLMVLATPMVARKAEAADAGAATVLSLVLPGSGEWYNSGFKGMFPWGECIIGHICCLFSLSSAFDAAAGKSDTNIRLDFWSSPR